MIRVKVRGLKEIQQRLGRLSKAGGNLSDPFRAIALYLQRENVVRFTEQKSPGGVPWKPSRRALEQNGQTLVDTGRLQQSILSESGRDFARVGTSLIYAATHQEGDPERNIPARPFLGVADDERLEVIRIIDRYFARLTRG